MHRVDARASSPGRTVCPVAGLVPRVGPRRHAQPRGEARGKVEATKEHDLRKRSRGHFRFPEKHLGLERWIKTMIRLRAKQRARLEWKRSLQASGRVHPRLPEGVQWRRLREANDAALSIVRDDRLKGIRPLQAKAILAGLKEIQLLLSELETVASGLPRTRFAKLNVVERVVERWPPTRRE